ncbi:hypothetical protein [Blastopirellula marina]|uniref:hypothetical protein n=1 Tax=Blastopirellula marina TaxID=124 RepID=UPI000318A219|nr:hypothetical protein [Blastopirellula marina]
MSRQVIEFREMQPASTRVARLIVSLHVLDRPSNRRFALLRKLLRWRQTLRAKPKPTISQLDIVFYRHNRQASAAEQASCE